MNDLVKHREEIFENGFTIIDNIYSPKELEQIQLIVDTADSSKDTFRKSAGLFAIRQLFKEIPGVVNYVFTAKLTNLIRDLFDTTYFVSKSMYFDKPEQSNWFVAYHQDLTISVSDKVPVDGFGPWTIKQNQFAVQPPLVYLEDNFTIRIHFDDTDEQNGALKVIPQTHKKGICRPDTINSLKENEIVCNVKKGSIMIMRPLLMHASGRTTNNKKRRVVHIELTNKQLPAPLNWSEKLELN